MQMEFLSLRLNRFSPPPLSLVFQFLTITRASSGFTPECQCFPCTGVTSGKFPTSRIMFLSLKVTAVQEDRIAYFWVLFKLSSKYAPLRAEKLSALKIHQPCTAEARDSWQELTVWLLPACWQRAASAVDADAGQSHSAVMTLSWWFWSVFMVAHICLCTVLC